MDKAKVVRVLILDDDLERLSKPERIRDEAKAGNSKSVVAFSKSYTSIFLS